LTHIPNIFALVGVGPLPELPQSESRILIADSAASKDYTL